MFKTTIAAAAARCFRPAAAPADPIVNVELTHLVLMESILRDHRCASGLRWWRR